MVSHANYLEQRAIGNTGVRVSLTGFGAAPIGNLYQPVEDCTAARTITAALSAGFSYIDTAPHYGFGLSEQRLGQVLQHRPRTSYVLSTKVGRLLRAVDKDAAFVRHGFAGAAGFEPYFDYTYDGIMRSFETSLQRLQTDVIDILLVHDLGTLTHGDQHARYLRDFLEGGYRAMAALKSAGVVRALGAGTNEWQVGEELLQHTQLDCLLLAGRYTLLEQQACETFFRLCQQRGVAIIAGGPFNSGILATGVCTDKPLYYNYEAAPLPVVEKVRSMEILCREFSIPLAAAALQFPAAHPCVSSVLAGFATPDEVAAASHWMSMAIPAEFWQELRRRQLIHPEAPLPVSAAPLSYPRAGAQQ